MRYFFILLTFSAILTTAESVHAISTFSKSKMDVELEFIVLEFPKYEKEKMDLLLTELHRNSSKIKNAQFNVNTQQLVITYYMTITLNDILEIISGYGMDFNKISGSELE